MGLNEARSLGGTHCTFVRGANMRRAVAYGTVTASLNVEGFGVDKLAGASREDVDARYAELMEFVTGV